MPGVNAGLRRGFLMSDLVLAIGLVLALEGALYAGFPGAVRRMLQALGEVSDEQLRIGGLAALATGVLLVWLVRG